MPLTMNVGLSRKVGEANYGSRGASVNFEVEVESTLVREPDQLRERIRYLFELAKQAVAEELDGPDRPDVNGNGAHGNGSHGHNGNGSQRPTTGRPATSAQVRAIHAIAGRNGLDLGGRLHQDFGTSRPDDLSISQASEFIDALKSQPNGTGGRR